MTGMKKMRELAPKWGMFRVLTIYRQKQTPDFSRFSTFHHMATTIR